MKRQRGAALMVILLIAGVLAAFFAVRALNGANTERDKVTAAALALAKDALIGYAVTYRDNDPTHANDVFGYLPCPDINNLPGTPGQADALDADCGGTDISTVRRLPWRTLGVEPLRDSGGECLWYAVSGHAKANTNKTGTYNWDTLGQFIVQDANGSVLHGGSPHDRPLGVVLAPRGSISGLSRAGPATECRGSNTIAAYLDGGAVDSFYLGTTPAANATTTLVLSTKASADGGVNNDQGLWITNREVFDRVKVRSDFRADINDMLQDLVTCLNGVPLPGLPVASVTNKGVGDFPATVPLPPDPTPADVLSTCRPANQLKRNVLQNWQDNLLYAKLAVASTVGIETGCNAVLFFSGERQVGQVRATAADKSLVANYLEGTNATLFPASGVYTGPKLYSPTPVGTDVSRCVRGLPLTGTQQSFAKDFASFVTVGVGVTATAATQTLTIADAPGVGGGCFWSPTSVPLASKVIRAYYDYRFSFADPFALTSVGADRGNGFSLQMVTGQFGVTPNTCGTEVDMGVLGAADVWGADSIIFETDVRRDVPPPPTHDDPVENHTAILLDGFLDHAPSAPGATISAACNGTATGCRHTPANKFEESPLQTHNQRIEIHTGCDATCTVCNPPAHAVPNNYARVTAWVDCTDCKDTATDINRVITVPTVQRCVVINPVLNTVYFGFTGGFRSGASQQGVTLNNLVLRTE